MKKNKILVTAIACSMLLAACGEEETNTNSEGNSGNGAGGIENDNTEDINNDNNVNNVVDDETNNNEENIGNNENEDENSDADNASTGDSEADEILVQSVEAMSDISSYSMEMDTEQIMTFDGEEIPMDMSIFMEVTQDPMMFHQVMSMPDPQTGEFLEVEQYMDEEGTLYMYDEMQDQWIKMDGAMMGIEDLEDLEMSPQEQLEMLQNFTENITVEEEADQYILNVEGSGDELIEISKEFAMFDPDPAMQEEIEGMMDMMDIQTFEYALYIDKETYYQVEMDMTLEMEITEGEETMNISQVSHSVFSDFDEVDEIEIPQDVIDNAVDIEDMEEPAL